MHPGFSTAGGGGGVGWNYCHVRMEVYHYASFVVVLYNIAYVIVR